MSKDFFQRKEMQEKGFDDQNFDDDFEACGLVQEGFKEKYENVFGDIDIDIVKANPVVTLAEALYKGLTARELAFVVAKDISAQIMDEINSQLKEEE